MRRATLSLCLLSMLLPGCSTPSVFEKRYVRIEIPGYAAKDYIRLLDSDNPDLRYLALGNLIEDKLTEGEAVSKRLGILLHDPSPKVRAISAFSVSSLHLSLSLFETSLTKLAHDQSADVRLEAVAALGKRCRTSTEIAHTLLGCLEDQSILVRLQAIDELRECSLSPLGSEIVHRLLTALPKLSQPEQLKLIHTLGLLEQKEEVESTLLTLLQSKEDPVITVSAEALGHLKSAAAVKPLLASAQQKRGSAEVIADALGSIGTPEAIQALLQLLNTDNETVRIAVILAIGETEGNVGLGELVERLTQQEARIQQEVNTVKWADFKSNYPEFLTLLEAIDRKRFGGLDKFVEPPVAQLLVSEKGYEQLIALNVLVDGKPYDRLIVTLDGEKQDLFPRLEALSSGSSPLMRVFALQALGNTVDSRALPILEAAVKDTSFGIRFAAIKALGNYAMNTGNYSPLSRLYEMREAFVPSTYTDEDREFLTRKFIDTTLAAVERKEITRRRRIAELLASSSRPTRLIAALQLEDNIALPVFFEFLETGTVAEKQVALSGIEKFSVPSTDTISKLRELKAKEPDPEVSKKIGQVIEKLQAK